MADDRAWPPAAWRLDELLRRYPGLAIRPSAASDLLIVAGELEFTARDRCGDHPITDTFNIELRVPRTFPDDPPAVRSRDGRVPSTFHTNPGGALCLGSPLRLRSSLAQQPSLAGFVDASVIPFLYAFIRTVAGAPMPFGELAHGPRGLLDDYRVLLGVDDDQACVELLGMLGLKKRVANKRACPCRSGRRVGRCHHLRLNRLRSLKPRSWHRRHAASIAPVITGRGRRSA